MAPKQLVLVVAIHLCLPLLSKANTEDEAKSLVAQLTVEMIADDTFPEDADGFPVTTHVNTTVPRSNSLASSVPSGGSWVIHIHAKNIVSALGATALCDKEVLRQLILHEGEHIKREIAGTGASGVSAEACEELEIKSMDLDRICDLLASQDPNDPDLVAFGKAIQIWGSPAMFVGRSPFWCNWLGRVRGWSPNDLCPELTPSLPQPQAQSRVAALLLAAVVGPLAALKQVATDADGEGQGSRGSVEGASSTQGRCGIGTVRPEQRSSIIARTASAEWKPYAWRVAVRALLLRPSDIAVVRPGVEECEDAFEVAADRARDLHERLEPGAARPRQPFLDPSARPAWLE